MRAGDRLLDVTDVCMVAGLVRIRNPWGRAVEGSTFEGEWGPSSRNWTAARRQALDYPEGAEDRGEYYLTWEEALHRFNR
jgi:hypothetical protein